jgi:hypothetical protein
VVYACKSHYLAQAIKEFPNITLIDVRTGH